MDMTIMMKLKEIIDRIFVDEYEHSLTQNKSQESVFYKGRAKRDNMSNPGDKDYEI